MALRNGGDPKPSPSLSAKLEFDPIIFEGEPSVRQKHPYVARFHQEKLPKAVEVVEEALRRYSPSQLAVAFNGGKDCTVLLDLVAKTMGKQQNSAQGGVPSALFTIVYFRSRPQFPALEKFIQKKIGEFSSSSSTQLKIYEGDLKESLAQFKKDFPLVEGIFMGTRCNDPRSKDLFPFSPTDASWPNFMRILPILHFSYHDVWLYLKDFNVSYCPIYDDGYTSIGWEGNTFPNPKLISFSIDGTVTYKPAFLLEDSDDERSARK